ncbi:MAG: ankyrin repeat domain-containing protein [Hyphomonas sp.]
MKARRENAPHPDPSVRGNILAGRNELTSAIAGNTFSIQNDCDRRLLNAEDPCGDTPLTLACTLGKWRETLWLLDAGADGAKTNWSGQTPLLCAVKHGHIEIANLLISYGWVSAEQDHFGFGLFDYWQCLSEDAIAIAGRPLKVIAGNARLNRQERLLPRISGVYIAAYLMNPSAPKTGALWSRKKRDLSFRFPYQLLNVPAAGDVDSGFPESDEPGPLRVSRLLRQGSRYHSGGFDAEGVLRLRSALERAKSDVAGHSGWIHFFGLPLVALAVISILILAQASEIALAALCFFGLREATRLLSRSSQYEEAAARDAFGDVVRFIISERTKRIPERPDFVSGESEIPTKLRGDYFVYLRPFHLDPDDRTNVDDFEPLLVRALERNGPVIALGNDRQGVGALRIATSDTEWKSTLVPVLHGARDILIVPHDSPGVIWEIEYLKESGLLNRTTFVMPPQWADSEFVTQESWSKLNPIYKSIGLTVPEYRPGGCLFRIDRNGLFCDVSPLGLEPTPWHIFIGAGQDQPFGRDVASISPLLASVITQPTANGYDMGQNWEVEVLSTGEELDLINLSDPLTGSDGSDDGDGWGLDSGE